ncbi:MAG: cell division protein ZapA [bacterium]
MDKSIITVNIFGSDYNIKGVAETDYMLKIAAYLNEKMNEIHDATGIKDPKRIAILASINICDELFEARKNLKDPVPAEQLQAIRNRIENLISAVDKELPTATIEIPMIEFKAPVQPIAKTSKAGGEKGKKENTPEEDKK